MRVSHTARITQEDEDGICKKWDIHTIVYFEDIKRGIRKEMMQQMTIFDIEDFQERSQSDEICRLRLEISELRKVIETTKKSSDAVRRGLFARHGELAKLWMDVHTRLEIIEKNLCNGG